MDSRPPEPTPASPAPVSAASNPAQAAEAAATGTPSPDLADSSHDIEWDSLGATRVVAPPDAKPDTAGCAGAPTAVEPTPKKRHKVGARIGDFQVVRKLGKGAMAAVYKARQVSFQRDVALKILYKHVADTPKLLERFHREARIMGQLDHPNIVQGYGVGEHEGLHYFAMEYVDGENLSRWLERFGRLSVGDALHVIVACARALEYAHRLDLVHRDVKPDNVLITSAGVIKLADLGMVKLLDEDLSLTQTGHAVGTPWYMPLEQARNAKETDGRCDIYALGCMHYHLLTGRPPFPGPTIVDLIREKEVGTFPPARQVNPAVPERLDLVIAKMTAKHPRHRYQTCTELLKDLEAVGLATRTLSFLATVPDATAAAPVEPTPLEPPAPPADLWYIRHKGSDGHVVERQLSTAEVLRRIEERKLGPTTRASRSADDGFRALATYREFEKVLLGKAAKRGADEQATRYRNLYKKIEAQEERRALSGIKDEPVVGYFTYWFGLALKIGIPIAGLAAVIYFLKLVAQAISG
jgi:serine/threonine-protein kinase